jgi:hypothetical protein
MMAKKAKPARKPKATKAKPAVKTIDAGVKVEQRPALAAALHGSGMTVEQAEAIVAALEAYLGIAGAPVANA